ncbi:MAG: hypothetical protein FJY66_02415 [Calditrichaeota bacterium]|nr:hypothetical protein [Calditrichota bacterium]
MRKCIAPFALFFLVLGFSCAQASTPAEDLFARMERHLQKLKSLEVVYRAEGAAFPEGGQSGRMIWVRPDGFYHDTPEWTLAQRGRERWRYLKNQQTLILEDVRPDEPLLPEQVLFAMREDVEPETLEVEQEEGSAHKLTLRATSDNAEGLISLWLRQGAVSPCKLSWPLVDGSIVSYRVESWREDMPVDDALFIAPQTEHLIDFRENKGRELR